MAVWLVRAGGHGEFQAKFLTDTRVYVTWDRLNVHLKQLGDREGLIDSMRATYPDAKPKVLINHASQVWPFVHETQVGDWVVLPLKKERAIQIGQFTGEYQFQHDGPNPFLHFRDVKWIGEATQEATSAMTCSTPSERF